MRLPNQTQARFLRISCEPRHKYNAFGDPGRIRTCNLPLRRGLLYPVEPRGLWVLLNCHGQNVISGGKIFIPSRCLINLGVLV